jgi:hypothetical protein
MKKSFLLFVVVLALVSLVAISCNQTVGTVGTEPPSAEPSFTEPPSAEPPGEAVTGEPQTLTQEPSNSSQTSSTECAGTPTFTHFEATPSTITWGQSAVLEWGPVTNGETGSAVDSLVLTPDNFGEVDSPGSVRVSPKTTTTYTLTASGCGGGAAESVTVVVEIVGITIPPIPGGAGAGTSKVTSVIAKAVPSSYTGPGPVTVNFMADITVDGPCTVTYNWERSDGAYSRLETLFFSAAGTKQVANSWMLGQGPEGSGVLWGHVIINTPIPMLSNKAEFNLNITP